jgi:hypothetical protein
MDYAITIGIIIIVFINICHIKMKIDKYDEEHKLLLDALSEDIWLGKRVRTKNGARYGIVVDIVDESVKVADVIDNDDFDTWFLKEDLNIIHGTTDIQVQGDRL